MTKTEMMNMLLVMTDEKDVDVLSAYIDLAGREVIRHAYPYREDIVTVPEQYHDVQLNVAAYLVNRRGAEGENVHLENGIARHYEDGHIPPTLFRGIVPQVGVI